MNKALKNTEVFPGDTSTTTEQDNVEQQKTTVIVRADRSRKKLANKAGFNQFSFKGA